MNTDELKQKIAEAIASGKIQPTTLILGDNVQHKIENVEAGGIGIQIVNSGKSSNSTPLTPGMTIASKKSRHFLETVTYKYRYLNTLDGNKRLSLLYQYLIREYRETKSYIAPDTKPDEFYSLFNGEANNNVITWTGSKQDLYYFIKRMVERNIVDIPQGATIWTITQNHFSDRRGNIFLDLRNQHNPQISAEAIERLIDILDPAVTTAADLTELSKKIGASFGGK